MANHLIRDYMLTGSVNNNAQPYVLSLFLRRVLRYISIGNTNFDLDTIGGLLVATGDTTPTALNPTFAIGNRAGINYGSGLEYNVGISTADHIVSSSDVGRILVLRSSINSTYNSGLFSIASVDIVNNRFIVSYRSTEFPPAETPTGDTLDWYLYEGEASAPVKGASRTTPLGGYTGDGDSTTSRIILQSPHSSSWQVRICIETAQEYSTNYTTPYWTACPGLGGLITGDFPNFGRHTHLALWKNSSSNTDVLGGCMGGGSLYDSEWRVYGIGDDAGQSIAFFFKNIYGSYNDYMIIFGIPDNESTPIPIDNAGRIFVIAGGDSNANGATLNDIGLNMIDAGGSVGNQGMAFNVDIQQPISCATSCWAYSYGLYINNTPGFDWQAGDSPYSLNTELLSIGLIQGTEKNQYGTINNVQTTQIPKPMGTIPFIRQGRVNFPNFSMTADKAWFHVKHETWMMWQGPSLM